MQQNPQTERQQPGIIQINQADVDDLADVAELMDLYRIFYGQPSNRPAAEQFLFERMINHESVIFLARDTASKQAAGFLQLYPTFSSVSLQPVWILNDLYVRPEYRRQGLGRTLMQSAIDLVKARGDKGLTLQTASDNLTAQALYESMGFQQDTSSRYYELWIHEQSAQ